MPYLLLVLGLLIGAYALYRFFLQANVQQIKALFFSGGAVILGAALFFLAVTGRLPAALALLAATIPFLIPYFKHKINAGRMSSSGPSPSSSPMDRHEALKILGLAEGASSNDIKAAYKSLMKKVHPDQEGSEWMASKLNEAKDFLLGNHETFSD